MAFRKTISIFLGSPGDVALERDAVQATVDEMNRLTANPLGYQLELLRWEDAAPGIGRPQGRLNQALARCDVFIGMLYKKWGTPPAIDGPYSSGFEEEFSVSMARQANDGSPDIWLMFKDIPTEFLQDPGPDLQKVLAFQQDRIAEKTLLYQSFADVADLQARLRSYIAGYLHNLSAAEREASAEISGQQLDVAGGSDRDSQNSDGVSNFSQQAATFLQALVEGRESQPDGELNNVTLARLRLVGLIRSAPGNDAVTLGVHDSNLLYEVRDKVEFGEDERQALVAAGLSAISSQTVPVWHWLPDDAVDIDNALALGTILYPTVGARAGALKLMTMVGSSIDHPKDGIDHAAYRRHWLANEHEKDIHGAALRYFARWGQEEDIDDLEALYAGGTSGKSLDVAKAAIELASRLDRQRAMTLILDLQPTDLPARVIDRAFDAVESLPPHALVEATANGLLAVRVKATEALHVLPHGAHDLLVSLKDDDSPKVRLAAIQGLEAIGEVFPLGTVEATLVRRRRRPSLFGNMSVEGRDEFSAYKAARLPSMSLADLTFLIDGGTLDAAVLVAFAEASDGLALLRQILDANGPAGRLVTKLDAERLNEVDHAGLVASAAYRLAAKRQLADLERLRRVIYLSSVRLTKDLLKFLAIHGDWSDVSRLAATALAPRRGLANALFILDDRREEYDWIADAMLRLGGGHLGNLLKIDMPPEVLAQIMCKLPRSAFRALSDSELQDLLGNAADTVRSVTCLRIARDLSAKKAASLLIVFMERTAGRYYNVIHWLDFAISAPRRVVTRAATNLLDDVDGIIRT